MSNGEDCAAAYTAVHLDDHLTETYVKRFGFHPEEVRCYLEAFSVFDRDHDGVISPEELTRTLTSLGVRMSAQEFQALLKGLETKGNGAIDFECFLHILTKKVSVKQEEELREVFSVFDLNSDGYIGIGELYDLMRRLGEDASMEMAEEMIKEASNNGGRVNFKDFKDVLTNK